MGTLLSWPTLIVQLAHQFRAGFDGVIGKSLMLKHCGASNASDHNDFYVVSVIHLDVSM